MKRKILALIVATLLVLLLCVSLVACNNADDKLPTIKFKDEMTADEIVKKLEKVQNFTVEGYNEESDELEGVWYVGQGYNCYMSENYNRWYIFNNKRSYEIDEQQSTGCVERTISIIDYDGYDCAKESDCKNSFVEYKLSTFIGNYKLTVEDGNLKASSEHYPMFFILKDFNKTEMPAVPQEYKGYKKMDSTDEPVKYELTEDGLQYMLTYLGDFIKLYEVPEYYDGKPVGKIKGVLVPICLEELTLPTTIKKFESTHLYYYYSTEPCIKYKGTKEQWGQIENHEIWSPDKGVRVTCSDGDYVETTTEV